MTREVIIGAVLGGGATALLLLAWAWFQRRRQRDEEQREPLAALSRRFQRWETLGVVLMLVAMALSWGILTLAVDLFPKHSDTVYRLGAGWWHWAIAAFCVGNLVATGPTHFLFQWWMGAEAYADFRRYQARKFGYDSRRLLLPFYVVFGAITARFVVLLWGWGVSFTPQAILIDPFWSGETIRYTYAEVLQIRIPEADGDVDLTLQFADGGWWSTRNILYAKSPEQLRAIAAYASERSGLPVVDTTSAARTERTDPRIGHSPLGQSIRTSNAGSVEPNR